MRNLFLIVLSSICIISYGEVEKKYYGNWILFKLQTLDSVTLENNWLYNVLGGYKILITAAIEASCYLLRDIFLRRL